MYSSYRSFQNSFFDTHRAIARIAILFGLLGFVTNTSANSIRCGVHLVSKGALQEEVLAKCGQPYSSSGRYWLYKQGQTVYRLQFDTRGEVRNVKAEIRF